MSRILAIAAAALATIGTSVRADEGGVSFWLTGQMASLAAVPSDPGWSVPALYYHASADASGSKRFVTGGNLVAGLDASADLLFLVPGYTFAQPVLGGQLALSMAWGFGTYRVTADVSLTTPGGATVSQRRTDDLTGGSDLYPMATLKSNRGANNWMVYLAGDIPTGAYRTGRLANIGINHGAIDVGGGYTYFNPQHGRNEFSIVAGITYNFENEDTRYKNGVDSHVDWAYAYFFSEQAYAGVVGYGYYQLAGDSGAGAVLGDNKSRVFAIGPQAGWFFPFAGSKGFLSLRGYYEFGAQNRAEGWNLYLTLALPLASK